MNFALFKYNFKKNRFLLLIFTIVMFGYLLLILSMYDVQHLENLQGMIDTMKETMPELLAAVGMDSVPTEITHFTARYFYSFLIHLFIIAHVIILPLQLVVKYTDRGSMAYLLATPNSREKIITTQAIYILIHYAVMMGVLVLLALIYSQTAFPGLLKIPEFLVLNLVAFLLSTALAAITFFFSCLWNEYLKAAVVSSSILITMFVLSLVGRVGHHEGVYGFLEKLSLFQFLEGPMIVKGEVNALVNIFILLIITLGFLITGIWVFRKKDIPL